MSMLVLMKDSFELRYLSLQILEESQEFARATKGGRGAGGWVGRREMETKRYTHTHTHTSREAAGMIPGESLRSFLGEGASETERESPRWLPSSHSSAILIINAFASIK